ncbi:hypothetical protein B0J12DRAFT_705651 [Macrophomina phaseolina]|uniref:F-box domain-containing protein n=1 Tax=Macrophomina phaseolina TaxID=35725 RepID=A0ABQ8FRH4_9PEZI|nr:hypothetical protein B0J12DRAFT_705651 [Macrophomina phaseolina]
MSKLSQELLDNILQYLSISDVAGVLRSTFNQRAPTDRYSVSDDAQELGDIHLLERSVSNRLDPASHLRKGFINVKQLVKCMSRTGTVLVGPRAFEYFSGEWTSGHDGTWDFLVQWFPAEVLDILIAFSKAGTTWETPIQRAFRQYKDCSECQEAIRKITLAASEARDPPPTTYTVLQKLSECSSHERHGILTSVRGVARDGKTPVILHIQELNEPTLDNAITAPLRHLCDVRLSHLQCMVAGYAAVHMNFGTTNEKKTVILHQSSDEPLGEFLVPEGYHVDQRHESHGVLRALADRESICINLSRFSGINRDIASAAHRVISFAMWYEYYNSTVHLPSLVDCASAGRVFPFLRYIWGDRVEDDAESLVGKPNHGFHPAESLMVLSSEYGVANDWI